MFKIRLKNGSFHVGGKDNRVWYFDTSQKARRHAAKHNLPIDVIMDSSNRIIPESEDAATKIEPKISRKPQTVVKPIPKKIPTPDKLTPNIIKIIVEKYRKEWGLIEPVGTIAELEEVKKMLLLDSSKVVRLSLLVYPLIEKTNSRTPKLIIEFMSTYFDGNKIISAIENVNNFSFSIEQVKDFLKIRSKEEIKIYGNSLLIDNNFLGTSTNLTAALIALTTLISEPEISAPINIKRNLTPEDITKQDIYEACKGTSETIEKLAENKIVPQWLITKINDNKVSQGFTHVHDKLIQEKIENFFSDILKQQIKELSSIPIDPRIILSKTLLDKIPYGDLNQEEKDIIYEARMIDPQLDKLTSYVLESKDYELTPIAVRLKENEGKLPLGLWQRISTHKQNGTMIEINKENLPVYQKLKFIINRIDSVSNRDDKELLVKTLFEFPQYNLKPLSPQLIGLIESYFNQLSQHPVSSFNKDDITKKLSLLDTIELSESDKRILGNIRSILNANTIQRANILVLDSMIHQNAKKLPKETLDFGKSEYSDITFVVPVSKEEKLLNNISSRITISTAPKVAHMVQDILSFDEPIIEELYGDMLAGKDTEVNEGLIYIYHKNLISPLIYNTIRTILTHR